MNLDELQSVQSRERQTDSLQQLRASFYRDAGEFIQQLRDERDRAAERAEDPFDSPEVNRLTDDIKTAEQTVEAVYERRIGKIVKMASLAAADMPTEEEGLTDEERDLFETLVEAIEANRGRVLDVLAGEASPGAVSGGSADATDAGRTGAPSESETDLTTADEPPVDDPAEGPSADGSTAEAPADDRPGETPPASPNGESPGDPAAGVDAADAMGGGPGAGEASTGPSATPADDAPPAPAEEPPADGPEPPGAGGKTAPGPDRENGAASEPGTAEATEPGGDAGGTAPDVERRTVRITDDVGEILGVDQREYDLSTDDVVTLPAANAEPLVERDAAEPLDR